MTLFGVTIPIALVLFRKDIQVEFVGTIPSTDNTISYADNNTAFNANAGFLRFNVVSHVSIKTIVSIDAKVTILIYKDSLYLVPMQTMSNFIGFYCISAVCC